MTVKVEARTPGDLRRLMERGEYFAFRPRTLVSERTPLLAAISPSPLPPDPAPAPAAAPEALDGQPGEDMSTDETLHDDDYDDDDDDNQLADEAQREADELDRLLSKSAAYPDGIGIEPAEQEAALLHGPRWSRKPSAASARCRSSWGPLVAATQGWQQQQQDQAEVAGGEEDGAVALRNPYRGGVSVARFWLIYSGILANLFVACFDMTILASSHPVITSYFHSSNSASWLSTAFLLTSTAFQPLFGRISDTMGRKPPFIFTLTVFLVATGWCALARSMTEFILARALCGLGAGGTLVMGSIITSDLVPIEIRGTYQSYINIVYGAGSALGAATGGAIADSLGWRWEFGFQVPFLAICLLLACVTVPKTLGLKEGVVKESLAEAVKKFDYKGSILLTISVTALILGLNLGGNIYAWFHPIVISSLVVFAIGFPLFLFCETRVALPIMPLDIISQSPRANVVFCNFLAAIIVNAIYFNIPLFFQAVLLESATDSGLRLMIPSLAATLAGVATGFLISWSKRLKWPLVAGAVLILVGTLCLCGMQLSMPSWVYLVFLVPSSLGQGFLFPGAFIALLSLSEQSDQAVVTSTMTLWRSLGMVLGVASSSLVVQNALVIYLDRFVTGPDKARVVVEVRASIRAIAALEPPYRSQVIDAYAASLRVTFVVTAVLALLGVLLVVGIRVPRLGRKM